MRSRPRKLHDPTTQLDRTIPRTWWDTQPYGHEYEPALNIYSFPSLGVVHRTKGSSSDRVIHSLSRLEFYALLDADFRTDVVDIREQYPAAVQSEVDTIAQALGVTAPQYKDGLGLTTDLLLTVRSGRDVVYEAVYCKYSSALLNRRANELFAIEHEVWARRRVRLREFTESSLTAAQISNLLWIHPFRRIDSAAPRDRARQSEMIAELWDLFSRNADRRISQVCAHADTAWGLDAGSALAVVRRAIAQHQWIANLQVAYTPGTRVGEFLCLNS